MWHQTVCAIWKNLLVLEVIQLNSHLAGILTAKGHICVNHFSTVAVGAMKTIFKPKLFASKSAPMQVTSFYALKWYYDENRIFPIQAILKHKKVDFMSKKCCLLFSNISFRSRDI